MPSTVAEISLVHLKSCLVNLPSTLVTALVNTGAAAQNVVVEIQCKAVVRSASTRDHNVSHVPQSVYVGWTGMPSKKKQATTSGRSANRGKAVVRDQDLATVELDATFGASIGLFEAQKVGVVLHLDPPLAHTVHIEPLTPGDWEIIELHATFLELNLLSQVRALPNPTFTGSPSSQSRQTHPLTLHLSPTSTANIIIGSIVPSLGSSSAFAKLSPDAEVIVAPKLRPHLSRNSHTESRSITSRKSIGGRSNAGASRVQGHRERNASRKPILLRAIDKALAQNWFEDERSDLERNSLTVWIASDVLTKKGLRGAEYVSVSVLRPPQLEAPFDPQHLQHRKDDNTIERAPAPSTIIARISPWDDAPDTRHVAMSSMLCSTLRVEGISGGVIRIEAAPPHLPKSSVKSLKIFPFTPKGVRSTEGFRFGGQTKASQEAAAEKLRTTYWNSSNHSSGMLLGPLTDGMVLPELPDAKATEYWEGGILQFDPPPSSRVDSEGPALSWISNVDSDVKIEVQQEMLDPLRSASLSSVGGESVPYQSPKLVSVDRLKSEISSHLRHCSSVLLTGGLGSGKTALSYLLAQILRQNEFFDITYFPCRKLVMDETRVPAIKEILSRLFLKASWGTRLGGRALVILDDLDKICPVETELQVGGDNSRSRQVSELISSIVRQYCGTGSGIVILATAQGKETLNDIIVGGHIVREIVCLKAPDKEARRQILESFVKPASLPSNLGYQDGRHLNGHKHDDEVVWMDGSGPSSRPGSSATTDLGGDDNDSELDFLDLAGRTDGYMPGDLALLVSRARSEALIRGVGETTHVASKTDLPVRTSDFERALKGFTPASLRNVTLQSSTTTFDSIGGLQNTRKILLETLQYPTTYAPIFAQCPLRLRSGLLLYGYPGCGKTLLASAVAGECGLNFISVKGPEILNKYIGASEKSIRDLFERAEAARPCVLFFDEFDSIAPKRGHDSTGVTDRVVNQLLTQMDGAEGLSGVYVLAATSRPDLIDPALLRPGRLDKSLICDLPSLEDRHDILRALSKKLNITQQVLCSPTAQHDLQEVARRTEGYSGADLQALIYNAHLEAIHDILDDQAANTHVKTYKYKDKKKGQSRSLERDQDFIQFRYGEEEEIKDGTRRGTSGNNRSMEAEERAAVNHKLNALRFARRRERRQEKGDVTMKSASRRRGFDPKKGGEIEVVIDWKHIEVSLAITRSSIGPDERRRLERIYQEFIIGRNGEMPNGQGPRDVGGRSSLM